MRLAPRPTRPAPLRSIVAVVLLPLVVTACATPRTARVAQTTERQPLLLIALDGFRWDYMDRYGATNLSEAARTGVRAEGLVPVFPTKTFPNHYTIVTGLYPEHHGIVANRMFDPGRDAYFSMGDSGAVTNPVWWGGEPIWVTAEKQGVMSATYFWPGSEAPIGGTRPTYWKPYDGEIPPRQRVREVLEWLDRPRDARPSLVTLYFSQTDHAGHDFGPDDPRTGAVVREIDAVLGDLFDGLRERDLWDSVNVLVVSDHGMAARSPDRVIFLDDYLSEGDARVLDWSPVLALWPKNLSADSLFSRLEGAHPHLQVFKRGTMPERFHYSDNPRIPPVIGLADEGWSVGRRSRYDSEWYEGGDHGYDNALLSMQGLFVAHGPAFRVGVRVPAFEAIHLYELMADILGITPAPNDGTPDATAALRSCRKPDCPS